MSRGEADPEARVDDEIRWALAILSRRHDAGQPIYADESRDALYRIAAAGKVAALREEQRRHYHICDDCEAIQDSIDKYERRLSRERTKGTTS